MTGQKAGCPDCHAGIEPDLSNYAGHITLHAANPTLLGTSCDSCHDNSLVSEHGTRINPNTGQLFKCLDCHGAAAPATTMAAITKYKLLGVKAGCPDCHEGVPPDLTDYHIELHVPSPAVTGTLCSSCHVNNFVTEHNQHTNPATNQPYDCETCHGDQAPQAAKDAILAYRQTGVLAGCNSCHSAVKPDYSGNSDHVILHDTTFSFGFLDCGACHMPPSAPASSHSPNLADLHVGKQTTAYPNGMDCMGCHDYAAGKLDPARVSLAIANKDTDCKACHIVDTYGHIELHTVQDFDSLVPDSVNLCSPCHVTQTTPPTQPPYNLWQTHMSKNTTSYPSGMNCASCHEAGQGGKLGALVLQVINRPSSPANRECTACHGFGYHPDQDQKHTATNIGTVYRDYSCTNCHQQSIIDEHSKPTSSTPVQGCGACHPNPVSSATPWNYSCSQGGCHGITTGPGSVHTDDSLKHASASSDCISCHAADVSVLHMNTVAANNTDSCGVSNLYGECHTSNAALPVTTDCQVCHPGKTTANHGYNITQHATSSSPTGCFASSCHNSDLKTEHIGKWAALGLTSVCDVCHTVLAGRTQTWAKEVKPWDKTCNDCHGTSPHELRVPYSACVSACHEHSVSEVHGEGDHKSTACTTCHGANAPGCVSCHEHSVSEIHGEHNGKASCDTCHISGSPGTTPPNGESKPYLAQHINNLYSRTSSDYNGQKTDITLALGDELTDVGYNVVNRSGATSVVTVKLDKDARLFTNIKIKAYVTKPSTSTTARVYTYSSNGYSVSSYYKDFIISSTGWQEWDVTSLAYRMNGYGWCAFRITAGSATFPVYEVRFITTYNTTTSAPHYDD
jgi:hypothetical protein